MLSPADAVAAVRALPREQRTAKVNQLLAGASENAQILHQRALIVTALRVAEVWPHGCPKT